MLCAETVVRARARPPAPGAPKTASSPLVQVAGDVQLGVVAVSQTLVAPSQVLEAAWLPSVMAMLRVATAEEKRSGLRFFMGLLVFRICYDDSGTIPERRNDWRFLGPG